MLLKYYFFIFIFIIKYYIFCVHENDINVIY
jgi:hypothetical protein